MTSCRRRRTRAKSRLTPCSTALSGRANRKGSACMTYVVDTHALVWFLESSPRLSTAAQNALTDRTTQVVVPTIVLAEITFLYARQRITIDLPHVLTHIASAANC